MNTDLQPWARHNIRKGRLRKALLEFGPSSAEALLNLARLDDPGASIESIESVLRGAPHKFYESSPGSWAAYPDEEVRVIYSRPYSGPYKKRAKHQERGPLRAYEGPEPPSGGRYETHGDVLSSVIIMGDELASGRTPRLLLEFKEPDASFRDAMQVAFEEEASVRFFSKEADGTVFLGTRLILDVMGDASGRMSVVASPARDDARKAIAPSQEQARLLLEARPLSQLPVPVDGSVLVPFAPVTELKPDERDSLSVPASPHKTDSAAVIQELRKIIIALKADSEAWSKVLPFLESWKARVDAETWERLLTMALNAKNAHALDLIEVLDLYLGEAPSPRFSSTVVQCLSKCSDPEGKIVDVVQEYAVLALDDEEMDYSARLCIARVFFRAGRYDEAAPLYSATILDGAWPQWDIVENAMEALILAERVSADTADAFVARIDEKLVGDGQSMPASIGGDVWLCLMDSVELVCRYRPERVVERIGMIIQYFISSGTEEEAKKLYLQYKDALKKYDTRLEYLSLFESCEARPLVEWALEQVYADYKRNAHRLIPALVESTAAQLEIAERIVGRECLYAADVKDDLAASSSRANVAPRNDVPLLQRAGRTKVAVVGGSRIYRERMEAELRRMGAGKVVCVAPSFEKTIDQATLKEKLLDVELVVQVTGYMKHAEHYMIRNLKHSSDCFFDVVPVNGGVSRGVMEITARLS